MLKRFLRRSPKPEPEPVVEKAREEPRGRIVDVAGPDVRGSLLAMISRFKRADYTEDELRKAARLPPIAAVIRTITREFSTYTMVVDEKDPADDDAPKRMLEGTLRSPNELERTWRVASDAIMRDLLIIGKTYVRLLRAEQGQVGKVAAAYLAGKIDEKQFKKQVVAAKEEPGAILGFQAHDPVTIRPNLTESGVWKDPAFYDVTALGPFAQTASPTTLAKCPSFTTDQMYMIMYTGTTEVERRLDPPSPTSEAYPLIDILYTMLVFLKNKLDRPQMSKLLSFVVPSDAKQMTDTQITNLVTDLREDLASGTLPVLPFVQAMVHDIGGEDSDSMWKVFQEIAIIAWQIFGAGGVQMLRMEGQGRQAATQQMEAAKHQAVGNMLAIFAEDFVTTGIIADRYSPYGGLQVKWVDRAQILTPVQKLESEHVPLMELGYPLGAVLKEDYPEKVAILEAAGIDPWTLYIPQIAAAWLKIKGELPDGSEEVDVMDNLVAELTRTGGE